MKKKKNCRKGQDLTNKVLVPTEEEEEKEEELKDKIGKFINNCTFLGRLQKHRLTNTIQLTKTHRMRIIGRSLKGKKRTVHCYKA